jgi:glyoxylase-like metal-dependent hydrolase (beta-lactamase superfamily II)/rhodanese-related sulfurtransferase
LQKKSKSKIKYVFETHFHADFISGHLTLSNLTGAKIVFGPKADPSYPAIIAEDNQVFEFGDISLTALHTPGHTLESTSYLLKDNNGTEQAIFTGDTLFLGDVGIPDVAQRYRGLSKEDLAGTLYDSVNTKIKPLSDNILVYPAHGAGSACGKNMMKETVDTLKNQKKINYALNGSFTKQGFIEKLTDNLPEPPSYFPHNVRMNQQGYDDLSEIIKKSNKPLSVYEFENLANDKKIKIVDVRHQDEFAKGHVPNSIFIGLDGGFAPWVGSVLSDVQQPILLVVDDGRVEEAITRLSRVGFDNVKGFLRGGFNSWVKANKKVEKIETILATEFENNLNINSSSVFDVRKLTEYQSEHVLNSINIPLNNISNFISDFNKEGSHYIHCAGGYRSMIANSILKQHGIHNLTDIVGGFSSIKKTKIETTEYICPTTL